MASGDPSLIPWISYRFRCTELTNDLKTAVDALTAEEMPLEVLNGKLVEDGSGQV
jgi:hypothetical protein